MLPETFFAALDDYPEPGRLEHLPVWARVYERDLRRLVSWWTDCRRQRPSRSCPQVARPSFERLQSLPLWADMWIRTLKFEVDWQRDQARANHQAPLLVGRR